MKYFYLAMTLAFAASSPAFAEVYKSDCSGKDWALISDSLAKGEVTNGANLKQELAGVLMEEMGPTCTSIFDTENLTGIPGDKLSQYEIETGSALYSLQIIESLENSTTFVSIKKKNK